MTMTVREAMSSQLVTVRETDSVLDGLRVLIREKVGGAPVVTPDFRLVGMVTEYDLLLALDFVGEEFPISRIMRREVISLSPDMSLDEARNLVLIHHHRRLPVVDASDGNKLVGVLSRRDILRLRFGL